jgi:hypothetical protein
LEEFYALPDRSAERDASLDSTSRLEPPDSDEVACRLRERRQPGSHEAPSHDDASPIQRRDERFWSWRSHSPETFRDLCRSESIHDDLDSAASATAHFEDPTTRHAAAEALQEWRDVLALHHGPQ